MNSQPAFNHRVMGSYIVERKELRKDREYCNLNILPFACFAYFFFLRSLREPKTLLFRHSLECKADLNLHSEFLNLHSEFLIERFNPAPPPDILASFKILPDRQRFDIFFQL